MLSRETEVTSSRRRAGTELSTVASRPGWKELDFGLAVRPTATRTIETSLGSIERKHQHSSLPLTLHTFTQHVALPLLS
ncbi:hypothetical protein MRB53_040399 [Persea americana]|nr:hypothetical protein MRB53_040399 [Persea americana]